MFRGSLFVTLALLFAVAPSVSAQQIHFSFGHGHHHGGHHYDHYWHGCHDPFWCGPSVNYVYAAPPPVVRREIRYVQPVEQVIETRVETPRAAAAPRNATALAGRTAAETPLQIWNSAGQRASVAFLTDGQQVSLGDGQSHTFYGGGTRTVEFDRGGDFGTARMQLTSGQYDFVVTADGWDLVRRADGVSPIALRPLAPKNPLPSEATRR